MVRFSTYSKIFYQHKKNMKQKTEREYLLLTKKYEDLLTTSKALGVTGALIIILETAMILYLLFNNYLQ